MYNPGSSKNINNPNNPVITLIILITLVTLIMLTILITLIPNNRLYKYLRKPVVGYVTAPRFQLTVARLNSVITLIRGYYAYKGLLRL
jgi:hypothetical protein